MSDNFSAEIEAANSPSAKRIAALERENADLRAKLDEAARALEGVLPTVKAYWDGLYLAKRRKGDREFDACHLALIAAEQALARLKEHHGA